MSETFQPNTSTSASKVDLTRLREWHESTEGQRFNLHADRWQLSSRTSVNIRLIRNLCWSPVLADGAVRTLSEYAQKGAALSVISVSRAFRILLEFAPAHLRTDEISSALVLSYRDLRRKRDGDDRQMAYIRPFLALWKKLGHPGVSEALVEKMSTWILKNPEPGVAVNRLDADAGPLMPDEHAALAAHWMKAFEQGTMTLDDFVMARLSSMTGRRPVQILRLKLRDMDDTRFEDAEPGRAAQRILLLRVPRAKGKGSAWRARFRAVPLSSDMWNLLMMQRAAIHDKLDLFLENIGLSLQAHDLAEMRLDMPLIPAWYVTKPDAERLRAVVARGEHGAAIQELRALAGSDAWHASPNRLYITFKSESTSMTDGDGEAINVFSRRLRYTREFELELANCTPFVIAWNMDHSDIRSLVSYSRNGPDRARSIGNAMELKLMPFAKMFQGRVVTDEADAEGGDDPASSRILFPGLIGGATCAAKRGCGMTAIPRPCYNGCPHFRPWVDGPHEEFLASLLEEREQALQVLRPVEDRAIIEAGDVLIICVVQVIRLCDQEREKLAQQSTKSGTKGRRARRGATK